MELYKEKYAELYDLIYRDKPYKQEAGFVDNCLKKCSSGKTDKILDLACGTGNHSFFLEEVGYKIKAIDISYDMIKCALRKKRLKNSAIDFQQGDMCKLSLSEESFDAVICLFDSIGYVQTNNNITKVIQNVYKVLRKDGLFVFEFWHGCAMVCAYEPVRIRRWKMDSGEIMRISETSIDYINQLAIVRYTICENNGFFTETHRNRFFFVQEMCQFLEHVGFKPLKWFSGFKNDENIDKNTWHIVCLAQKTT